MTARFGSIDYQTSANATWTELPDRAQLAGGARHVLHGGGSAQLRVRRRAGQTAYQQLFPDGDDPIGQYVLLKNVPFQVIGVMSPKGATAGGNDADDVIFVPLSTGSLRLFGQRFLRSITVAVKDVALIDVTQDALTELLDGAPLGQGRLLHPQHGRGRRDGVGGAEHADHTAGLGRGDLAAGRAASA